MALAQMAGCPQFGDAILKTWDLNTLGLAPTLSVQGNRYVTSVAPATSVWFTAESAGSVISDHGTLVNLDPATSSVRTWDLDTRLGLTTGQGANLLDQDVGNIWVTAPPAVVHRIDPVGRGQWTWNLPVNPITSIIRGMRMLGDGSLMISLESTSGAGAILQLDATTGILRTFTLPEESAPFGGDVTPDGLSYWFCEFTTKRLAVLNPTTLELAEYLLPADVNPPIQLFVADDGTVWFVDGAQVGHFDPQTGALILYSKAGVLPQEVEPIAQGDGPPLVVLADAEPFIDVLCATAEPQVFLPETGSQLTVVAQPITPSPSRPNLMTVELVPEATVVSPVDPGDFTRYATPTPTRAAASFQGLLYANGVDFVNSIFRLYQLTLCGQRL